MTTERRDGASDAIYWCAFLVLLAVPGLITGLHVPLAYIGLALVAVTFALYVMWYGKPVWPLQFDKLLLSAIVYFLFYIAIVATATLPGVLRDTKFNTWLFALLSLGFVIFLTATAARRAREPVRTLEGALFAALLMLCVLQLAFYSLGVEHAEKNNMPQINKYISSFLFFDIYSNRVAFPLSSSMQYSATYPSLLLAISLIRFWKSYIYKISSIISFVMLILIDARGFFVAPIFAYFTYLFTLRLPPSSAAVISVAIPTVPVLIYKVRDLAQPLIYLVFPERNRSSEMFSNRGYIWEQYFSHFDRFGDIEKLFGFGGYGQYTSRLSESFLKFFTNFDTLSSALVSMHNSYLQILMDFGIIGFIIFLIFLYYLFYRIFCAHRERQGRSLASLLLMLLTIQWVAGSEVILTPYAREGFVVTSALWIMVAMCASVRTSRQLGNPTPYARAREGRIRVGATVPGSQVRLGVP